MNSPVDRIPLVRFLQRLFWPTVFLSWVPFITLNGLLALSPSVTQTPELVAELFPRLTPLLVSAMIILAVVSGLSRSNDVGSYTRSLLAMSPLVFVGIVSLQGQISSFPQKDLTSYYFVPFVLSLVAFSFESTSKERFWWFFVVAFIDCVFYRFGFQFFGLVSQASILGVIYTNYLPSLIGLALTTLLVIVARSANLVVSQNASHLRNLSAVGERGEKWTWFRQALWLWSPMFLFFVAMSIVYSVLDMKYVRPCLIAQIQAWEVQANNESAPLSYAPDTTIVSRTVTDGGWTPPATWVMSIEDWQRFAQLQVVMPEVAMCQPSLQAAKDPPSIGYPHPRVRPESTVSSAVKSYVEKLTMIADLRLHAAGHVLKANASSTADQVPSAVASAFDALPSRLPGTETKRCKWYDVACLLVNGVKSTANSFYVKQRDQSKAKLVAEAQEQSDKRQDDANVFFDEKLVEFTRASNVLRDQTNLSIDKLSLGLGLISLTLSIYSAMILAKSYLLVLARVIYSRRALPPLADRAPKKQSEILTVGSRIEVTETDTRKYFVRRSAIGLNVVEKIRVPQWKSSVLSRIMNGCYFLCLIEKPEHGETSDIRVDAPAELVIWNLQDNEEIVFGFSDFVGMTGEVRLRRYISLQLASLVMGRVFYHCAHGPGKLILQTSSVAIVGEKASNEGTLHVGGLVAWNVSNEYFVRSSLTHIDVFFSGCNLRRTEGNQLIFDTSQDRRRVGGLRGIWRMATTFLLPV